MKVGTATSAYTNLTLNLEGLSNLPYPASVTQINIEITTLAGF